MGKYGYVVRDPQEQDGVVDWGNIMRTEVQAVYGVMRSLQLAADNYRSLPCSAASNGWGKPELREVESMICPMVQTLALVWEMVTGRQDDELFALADYLRANPEGVGEYDGKIIV